MDKGTPHYHTVEHVVFIYENDQLTLLYTKGCTQSGFILNKNADKMHITLHKGPTRLAH